MGTEEQVVPSEWQFFGHEFDGMQGYMDIMQDGVIYVRMQKYPKIGVMLPPFGVRRLYTELRKIFEPTDKNVAEGLALTVTGLEKELAALKDQRRWELYLVFVETLSNRVPTHRADTTTDHARRVDEQAKAYVNAIMPADSEKTDVG